jgi:ribosomal protein L28
MKACPICTKSSQMVGNYSNRVRATKYNQTGKTRKQPNLQWAPLTGGGRLKICTSCLKKGKNLQVVVIK